MGGRRRGSRSGRSAAGSLIPNGSGKTHEKGNGMKKIGKLKRKKGFTLVELIVVIAIVGVLLMLIVPAMTADNRPTAGKGYAKDFFYAAQGFMSRQKLSGAGSLSQDGVTASATDDLILYAEMTGGELDTAHCGIAVPGTGLSPCSGLSGKQQTLTESFMREINNRTIKLDYEGTLYAVIDDAYRVRAAYWTDGAWADVDGQSFMDNCVLASGVYACSFPTALCTPVDAAGETMFQWT